MTGIWGSCRLLVMGSCRDIAPSRFNFFSTLQLLRAKFCEILINGSRERYSAFNHDILTQGDSSVLHCASLLRTIFAPLARAI